MAGFIVEQRGGSHEGREGGGDTERLSTRFCAGCDTRDARVVNMGLAGTTTLGGEGGSSAMATIKEAPRVMVLAPNAAGCARMVGGGSTVGR